MIRDFTKADLVWIKPLAEKFGEWEAVQTVLSNPYEDCWVSEPLALGCVYQDPCGYCLVGLTDREGVKALFKMAVEYLKVAREKGIILHTHVAPESWQYEFFERLGMTPGKVGTLSIGE